MTFEQEFQQILQEMREAAARDRKRAAQFISTLCQTQLDGQKDHDEYTEEMSLGGRTYEGS